MAAIAWSGPTVVAFGDGPDYLATARHVCEEHAYPDRESLPFFRAPLLPAFIAATTLCHPERIAAVKVALALCDSLTAVLVGEVAWLLFASSAVAGLAALLAAVDPFFIAGVCDIRTEPLAMLFLTAAIWLLLGAVRNLDLAKGLLSGVAFASSALARPAGLAALSIAIVSALFAPGPTNRRWRLAMAVTAGGLVALFPWIARNAIRYHEFIVVNDAAGYNFWRGSHPEMDRISRIKAPSEYRGAARVFETVTAPAAARAIEAGAAGPRERSRAFFEAGVANVRQDPVEALAFAARRAWRYWCPWLNPQEYSMRVVVASAVLNTGMYVLAAIGLFHYRRQDPLVVGWLIVYFLGVWLAHVPYQVVMRFRIPFTDPLLIVFASATVFRGIRALRASRGESRQPLSES